MSLEGRDLVGNSGENRVGVELMPEGAVCREESSLDLPVLVVGVVCAAHGLSLGGSAEDHMLAWDVKHGALCHSAFLLATNYQWQEVFHIFCGLDKAKHLARIERGVVHVHVADTIVVPVVENAKNFFDGVARASCLASRSEDLLVVADSDGVLQGFFGGVVERNVRNRSGFYFHRLSHI